MPQERYVGVDFSASPSPQKPIWVAALQATPLPSSYDLVQLQPCPSQAAYLAYLRQQPLTTLVVDGQFGLPRAFVQAVAPHLTDWDALQAWALGLGRAGWLAVVENYVAAQPMGQKYRKRRIDLLAHSQSPLNYVRPPMAKMFFSGLEWLAALGWVPWWATINKDMPIISEAYPALVARRLMQGKIPYKDGSREQAKMRAEARAELIKRLQHPLPDYGVQLELTHDQQQQIYHDPQGDALDAVLAGVQAVWLARQRKENMVGGSAGLQHLLPTGFDPLEGWIFDPTL